MNILLIVEAKILVLNDVDYRYLLAEFGQPPMDSEFSEFSNNGLLTYPLEAVSLSCYLAEQGQTPGMNLQPCGKYPGISLIMGTTQHQKSHLMTPKRLFLQKMEFFPSLGQELEHLCLKDFLKHECDLYLKQSLTPPQCKIIVAHHTSNHRLVIETRRWSAVPISGDNRLCHFCLSNVVENEAHIVLETSFNHYLRRQY